MCFMHDLENLLHRCRQRHKKPLRQKKTIVTPSIYKGYIHHFTVFCAKRYPVRICDLEQANISIMPIGRAPEHDRVPQSFGGNRFKKRQVMTNWDTRLWHTSWGIQIYTGVPSSIDDAHWHDLEFKYDAIRSEPDAILTCIETLINIVPNPLLTITRFGGLRFSCRISHYLHPKNTDTRLYIYKDKAISENMYERNVFLEIRGEEGHTPWDARYEIVMGNLLEPPVIAKEMLFTSIDALRKELHAPNPKVTDIVIAKSNTVIESPPSLGSHILDLAKEAFLKRGFTYLTEKEGIHHWTQHTEVENNTDVLLWEYGDTAWIRATTQDIGVPMENTQITDVWDDTGILPPVPADGLPVSDKLQKIREGKHSPLAIKRPNTTLQKSENPINVNDPLEKNINIQQKVHESKARVIGLSAEIGARNQYELEKTLINAVPTAFSGTFTTVEEATKHFQKANIQSLSRWRHVRFLWDQIKQIPVEQRMANPFQHGNVCEDTARFLALTEKGINATEILCPKCPVYTDCNKRGYLSQAKTFQHTKTQIFGFERMFIDPHAIHTLKNAFEPIISKDRLYIINDINSYSLMVGCVISKELFEEWQANWKGLPLGNFALALLNVLQSKNDPDDLVVKQIRTVMRAYQHHEAQIVKQMCQVNIKARVTTQEVMDENTDELIARCKIEFDGGVTAFIPMNNDALDKLTAKGLPVFQPESYVLNENIRIPMSINDAIHLQILDIDSVENIQTLPKTMHDSKWTVWHLLKRFLSHYKRDADAPIIWQTDLLQFWVPPALHPNIEKLLIMSANLSEHNIRRVFPHENIEVIRINPTPWISGNQVFQCRSGVYTLWSLLDYDSTWDVVGLSKLGERILLSICAEIERDPKVKHAIITYDPIIEQLRNMTKKENLCLLTEFKHLQNLEPAFEAADVIWIVGTPYWHPSICWHRAQILYGNDEEPLNYEGDTDYQHYKDERIQRIYQQMVSALITNIIGYAGLKRLPNKKVMLISSLEIPDITDRPETTLFDWEDFEIAGNINKLSETISIRQHFETESVNISAETRREEVERVLGCSTRQANRVLQKLRGGNIPHVTFREQILSILSDGEKKAAEVISVIEGNSVAIHHELVRLTKLGEIVKVRRGVYALPDSKDMSSNENSVDN